MAYAAYFEAGRIDFLNSLLGDLAQDQNDMVIASLKIDYAAEMFYPGTVEVGSFIQTVGNRSFSVFSGAFKDGKLHAMAQAILVNLDGDSHAPAPIPPPMRKILSSALSSTRT